MKLEVYGLNTDLLAYTGQDPIQILSNNYTLRETYNANHAFEAGAIRAMSYYSEEVSKGVKLQQTTMAEMGEAS